MRTRAGLGSGLELTLPGGLWTNVPVSESFAQSSPYLLRRAGGRYRMQLDGQDVAEVRLSPRPRWYDATTASGKAMTRIGTLQGTYLDMECAALSPRRYPLRELKRRALKAAAGRQILRRIERCDRRAGVRPPAVFSGAPA